MVIVKRPAEIKRINETNKWMLVYGRRKTGKTFIVRNFVKHDEYFFVKKDRGVISEKTGSTLNYDSFMEVFKRALSDNKTVVIDEFHRLGEDFFDYLHFSKKEGMVILISSTLYLSKKLLAEKSSLLGLFAEFPVGLISLSDCLESLKPLKMSNKELLETAVMIKEPIAIEYVNAKKPSRELLIETLTSSLKTYPSLVGEIFIEEEKSLSQIYEGILRAVSCGKVVSSEISSYLYSRKLIKKDDPSIIQQSLRNLVDYGIIKRVPVFNKKRFIYKHVSPLARIFYYADEKYNLSERIPPVEEVKRIIDELMPRIIEDTVREHLSQKYGLMETVIEGRDYDIDGYLLRFKAPEVALEVKWKELSMKDIKEIEKNLEKIDAKRKILFVPEKKGLKSEFLEIIDVKDL